MRTNKIIANRHTLGQMLFDGVFKQAEEQVWGQVEGQIKKQVWKQVCERVSGQVWDQVLWQLAEDICRRYIRGNDNGRF